MAMIKLIIGLCCIYLVYPQSIKPAEAILAEETDLETLSECSKCQIISRFIIEHFISPNIDFGRIKLNSYCESECDHMYIYQTAYALICKHLCTTIVSELYSGVDDYEALYGNYTCQLIEKCPSSHGKANFTAITLTPTVGAVGTEFMFEACFNVEKTLLAAELVMKLKVQELNLIGYTEYINLQEWIYCDDFIFNGVRVLGC